MTDPQPNTGADRIQALDAEQLGAYFALMEAVSLLQHHVEQQLRNEGGLSYVQFQLLARLVNAQGQLTMTQLADGVVYSRSGLTYQAGLLEKAGLITRGASSEDERATVVTITDNGRALFDSILPGHIQVVRRFLLDPLTDDDLRHLGDIMTRTRDHMRTQPPRSAAPRKRRPSTTAASPGLNQNPGQARPTTATEDGLDTEERAPRSSGPDPAQLRATATTSDVKR